MPLGFGFGHWGFGWAVGCSCFGLDGPTGKQPRQAAIFLFFVFVFYKNIFSISKLTEIYPGSPGGRNLVTPLRGGRDFSVKNFVKNLYWRTDRPSTGRPANINLQSCWRLYIQFCRMQFTLPGNHKLQIYSHVRICPESKYSNGRIDQHIIILGKVDEREV